MGRKFSGMSTANVTISVFDAPNRALRFHVGVAILYAIWRCQSLILDLLFSELAFRFGVAAAAQGGIESVSVASGATVTAVLLGVVVEFVFGFGSIAIFALSVGWSVVRDLSGGADASLLA